MRSQEAALAPSNAQLGSDSRFAVGEHIRRCWYEQVDLPQVANQVARLSLTTDAGGTVRDVRVMQMSNAPGSRIFAERAMRAVLSTRCATLPLPAAMLGSIHTFDITFRP